MAAPVDGYQLQLSFLLIRRASGSSHGSVIMTQPEREIRGPEDEPTALTPQNSTDVSQPEFLVADDQGEITGAETVDSLPLEEQSAFSPSEDTMDAIQDLGLRLQPVQDRRVIGRMAHYDILRCLGRGGMGTVFEAFDTRLFRPVAIKFMASSLAASPKARSRFLREARVAASINHPNVVTIHSVDEYEGRPYLVMEFVSGTTLHDYLRRNVALPVDDVLRIGRQIASGLRAAHERGIVHRDIKPGNILLENGVQRVKIVDFGLAQVVFETSDITSQGQTLGTPRYMSPEQIEGARVDERADLFSLGCVLYAMCVGQPPFSGNSITVLHSILRDSHVPIRQVVPEVPAALSDMVDTMLSKPREHRIQTAAKVEEMLMAIARGAVHLPDENHVARLQVPAETSANSRGHLFQLTLILTVATLLLMTAFWWFDQDKSSRLSDASVKGTPIAGSVSGNEERKSPAADKELVRRSPTTFLVGGEGADFSTLREAALQVQSGDTLSVQGPVSSDDELVLNNPARHSNLTIEWKKDAVLEYSGSKSAVISVESVSGVTIRGARIRAKDSHLLAVRGPCQALTIERCVFEQAPGSRQAAVVFWNTAQGSDDAPIRVQDCQIVFFELGLAFLGTTSIPVEFIELNGNRIRGLQPEWGTAIMFENSVAHIKLVKNRIASVRAGVNVTGTWNSINAENNTFFDVIDCFGTVEGTLTNSIMISGNLALQCDKFFFGLTPDESDVKLAFNKADAAVAASEFVEIVSNLGFVSLDPVSENFLIPLADPQLSISAPPGFAGALEPRSRE